MTEALIDPWKGRSALAGVQHQEAYEGAAHAGVHDRSIPGLQVSLQVLQPGGRVSGFLGFNRHIAEDFGNARQELVLA